MLLIDGNNLAFREGYSKIGLSYHNKPTNVIFGFLQQIRKLMKMFPGEICFCWDSKESLRKRFYPQYKANRHKDIIPEEIIDMYSQMTLLREELLPRLGLPNQFLQHGYEADDLIAQLCTGPMSVIVSSDNDLFQLLSSRNTIYNLGKKKIYPWQAFKAEYGVFPGQWPEIKAIAGDTSDGIDGVPGVGIKTAVKYFLGGAKDRNVSSKIVQKILDHAEIIARNRILIKLPWAGCDPGTVLPSRFDDREFMKACAEWGLRSLE